MAYKQENSLTGMHWVIWEWGWTWKTKPFPETEPCCSITVWACWLDGRWTVTPYTLG